MISLEEAKSLKYNQVIHDEFGTIHEGGCVRWRVNGKVKTWKRSPNRVKVPVKHELWGYDYLTEEVLSFVHLEKDCPRVKK